MPRRKGVRTHKAFAVDCDIREEGKIVKRTLAYRAHAESEVRKKTEHRLAIIRVHDIREIDEAEYDKLMQSKKFPNGLKPDAPPTE